MASHARLDDCSSLNGDGSPLDKPDFFNNHRSLTDQRERLRLTFLHARGRPDARLRDNVVGRRAHIIQREEKRIRFQGVENEFDFFWSQVAAGCVRIEHATRETGEIPDDPLERCREGL